MHSLDLTDGELRALLSGAQTLVERELAAVRQGPIFEQPPSAERIARLLSDERELPLEPEPLEELLQRCEAILTAGRRTAPGFFGYVLSPASPVGVAADMVASAANQNLTAWRSAPAAAQLEWLVVRWLGQLAGFSEDAAGILVSGGSLANLTALLLALRAHAEPETDRRTLVAYASREVHFSVAKAADVIGVRLRPVAVDRDRRLDVAALEQAIRQDRARGQQPFCVVASAGTTATGAVDRLDAIAALAREQDLWLHVDGAYGALAASQPSQRHLFDGIEQADSLSIDPHKWLYVPIDCGALLLRQPSPGAFGSAGAEYVRILADEELEKFAFWDHGIELSRRFRALKVWMTIRYYGARRLAAAIANDIAMASEMAELVRAAGDLELMCEPSLSICCFRHVPPGVDLEQLDAHNERLLQELQRTGVAYLSNASIDGRFALRACITNFRTTSDDVRRAVDLVRNIGAAVHAGLNEPPA